MRLKTSSFLLLFIALVSAQNENITSTTTDALSEIKNSLKLENEGSFKNETEINATTKVNLHPDNPMTTPGATDLMNKTVKSSKETRELGKMLHMEEEMTLKKSKSMHKGEKTKHEEAYEGKDEHYEEPAGKGLSEEKHLSLKKKLAKDEGGKGKDFDGLSDKGGKFLEKDEEITISKKKSFGKSDRKHKSRPDRYEHHDEHYDEDEEYDEYDEEHDHTRHRPKSRGKHKLLRKKYHAGGRKKIDHHHDHYDDSGEYYEHDHYRGSGRTHYMRPYFHYDHERKLEHLLKTLERMETHKYGCSCEGKDNSYGKPHHHEKDVYEEKVKSMLDSLEKLVNKNYDSKEGGKSGYVEYPSHKEESKPHYAVASTLSNSGSSYKQYARSAINTQSV